jgi:hypothetical protein
VVRNFLTGSLFKRSMQPSKRIRRGAVACAVVTTLAAPAGASAASAGAAWHFRSAPTLRPPELTVTTNAHRLPGSSLIFTTPFKDADVASPEVGQPGALIMDTRGNPVWFHPTQKREVDEDLQPQTDNGKPVLTFWQGVLATQSGATANGLPAGAPEPGAAFEILNQRYQVIKTIKGQDGWTADYHEFLITPQGDALYLVAKTVKANLSTEGGAARGAYEDSGVQALNLATGKVLYTWDMADHVPLTQSAVAAPKAGVWDPYHLNSIFVAGDGSLIISARNTWSVYDISPTASGGPIDWTLDAKPKATDSTFTLGAGAAFSWQHDAQLQRSGELTLFDDHCCALGQKLAKPLPSARGEVLALSFTTHTATLVHSYPHSPPLLVPTQGNMQTLSGGDVFLDWGQQPVISAATASGHLIYNAALPAADSTYRAYLLPWTGLPGGKPAISVVRTGANATVYASWNGATRVAAWELLAGAGRRLKALGKVARAGFETAIHIQGARTLNFQIKALDARGTVLASSAIR